MNKTVIFDLDGTIYFGENIANEALKCINTLIENDFSVLFLTNNSTKTRAEINSKLNNLGIMTDKSKIYSSSYAAAKY
ncbi:MAG: TIGR01457 family HAD-type hydrolase, partial [Campylobacterales bacterium]|nr:TIGR01457 family HAD-type hydrolase [Campylobacterales bacterium]